MGAGFPHNLPKLAQTRHNFRLLCLSAKPCTVKRTGQAFLRFADGDYALSRLEVDGFAANRTRPRFDESVCRIHQPATSTQHESKTSSPRRERWIVACVRSTTQHSFARPVSSTTDALPSPACSPWANVRKHHHRTRTRTPSPPRTHQSPPPHQATMELGAFEQRQKQRRRSGTRRLTAPIIVCART